jgi:hypothetical protein
MAWRTVAAIFQRNRSVSSFSEVETHAHEKIGQIVAPTDSPTVSTEVDLQQQRRVGFSTISMRYYNLVLGDNPGCEFPLALGWSYTDADCQSLYAFDDCHHVSPDGNYVNAKHFESMALCERTHLLRAAGHSVSTIRRQERHRRIGLLLEWFNRHHGCDTDDDDDDKSWANYCFPENSGVLTLRYVIERRSG